MTDTIRKAMRDFPGVDEANAVLTYGYIDHEAGLTVEFPMEVVRSMLGILIKMMEDGINE